MVRDDDNEETVKSRLEVYEVNTKPLIEYYDNKGLLFSVDGSKKPDEIFEVIKSELNN
jgi:adenylate kinase